MCQYAREHVQKEVDNVSFICGDIAQKEFWSQLANQQPQLKEDSVDLVIATHRLRVADPDFEVALDNISRMLKPGQFPRLGTP